MSRDNTMDSMLEMFIYETTELVTQLENIALDSSEESSALESQMNEVFRIVHTIKGAAAMMDFNSISSLAHSLEDAFFYIRENNPDNVDYSSLTDVTLRTIDYIKEKIAIIQVDPDSVRNSDASDEEAQDILKEIKEFVASLKGETPSADSQEAVNQEIDLSDNDNSGDSNNNFEINLDKGHTGENEYKALLRFEDGCEMENLRSFKVLKNLEDMADIVSTNPPSVPGDAQTTEKIRQDGFEIILKTDLGFEDVRNHLSSTLFLKELYVEPVQKEEETQMAPLDNVDKKDEVKDDKKPQATAKKPVAPPVALNVKQSIISVNLEKLDKLMDLVGELVISQEMVVQNSELDGLVLNDFQKASRQLRKVTTEIQDAVMSIRMVPISATFHKMQRIVRDMSKKLGKDVKLELVGETTEVDKNVVEHLTDPLMHIIRNSMDHGIESTEDRIEAGKPAIGTVTLEARDEGGDVRIIIRDDGRGLDREKLLQKAINQGLVRENEELADKDIYSLIFKPGFSTKQQVTEFSGRGVGMDVVNSNMEKIGGKVLVDSSPGEGTTITLKIPLTLAIIDGMKVQVGDSIFVIPITSIKESFRVDTSSIILDDCNSSEMIMIRGECLPILRLHDYYNLESATKNLKKGIVIIVENESSVMCLFADKVIGEQQVVVKPLPKYIKDVKGISGCTVMGDGSVCLISDVTDMFKF